MRRARFVTGHRATVYTAPSKKRKRRRNTASSKPQRRLADMIDAPADTAARRARKLGNRPP